MKVVRTLILGCAIAWVAVSGIAPLSGNNEQPAASKKEKIVLPKKIIPKKMSDYERALYQENPWLFIQKKLIEEPNDELMGLGWLGLDTLLVGWVAAGVFIIAEDYSRNRFGDTMIDVLGGVGDPVFVCALVNGLHKLIAEQESLQSFLAAYAHGEYKKYTPSSLQPLFDELAKIPPEELAKTPMKQLEVLADMRKAVEEHNPGFKFEDNFHKKLKFLAGVAIATACIYVTSKFYDRLSDMSSRNNTSYQYRGWNPGWYSGHVFGAAGLHDFEV